MFRRFGCSLVFVLRDSVSSRCHPRPRLAAGSVAAGSVAQAVRLHAQFYKKTKQLPVLGRCCDEIQPHQWRPPVEREEHRLPFWLKVGPLRGGHARASGPLPTSGAEPAARGPPVRAHPHVPHSAASPQGWEERVLQETQGLGGAVGCCPAESSLER